VQGYYFSKPVSFPRLLDLLLAENFVSDRMQAASGAGAV